MIAKIIINSTAKSINREYDYLIPKEFEATIKVGNRVFVPFGKAKTSEGFVVGIQENSKFANKELLKVENTGLTEENISLAKLMAFKYFCNISDCIRLMLPPNEKTTKMNKRAKKEEESENIFANKDIQKDVPLDLTEEQQKVYDCIKNSDYKRFLIHGVTGSRQNRNLFAIN